MPLQPPTRPHSANPQVSLRPSIFSSTAIDSKSSSFTSRNVSSLSFQSNNREVEWEDAWDSSSDTEDHMNEPRLSTSPNKTRQIPAPVPIPPPITRRRTSADSEVIAASWASTSYHHVASSPSSSPASVHRPQLSSSKTFTDGVTPPQPGTHVRNEAGSHGSGSKPCLPPGGAWEMVEPADIKEELPVKPVVAGKEAVREDVEDILRGQPPSLD